MSVTQLLSTNRPQGIELRFEKLVAGVASALPAGKTLDIGGATYTADELAKKASDLLAYFAGAREARAALREKVADRKRVAPEAVQFLSSTRSALENVLGRSSPELEKLGFPPRKVRRPLTAEEKLLRAAKAKLTRALRKTLGPRQKEQLRAEGTPVVTVGPDGTTVVPAAEAPASAGAEGGAVPAPGPASEAHATGSPSSPRS